MDHHLASAGDRLGKAIAEARRAYAARNPASLALHQAAAREMPGGNTRTVLFFEPFPLAMVRGEGCRLWDADAHIYLDLLGEYTAGLFGHSHPAIRAALERAMAAGLNLAGHTPLEARFARAVRARYPSLDLVRFTNSGTEANLMALALAGAVTGRRKVMVFEGGYHGALLTFRLGANPLNVPHDFVSVPYNDPEAVASAARAHGGDLAAIVAEPMLGSGGCIPGEPEFLRTLRAAADQTGALLVFDEVMTSRLAPGGLQAAVGVKPDLTTLGKYIGGGMSFGAFGGRADLMSRFDPRRPDALAHAGTFNNNVLTMSAGIAALEEVFTPGVQSALNARGEALRERLNAICRRHLAPVRWTGIGSLLTMHTTAAPVRSARDAAAGDPRLKELLFFDLLERGIYLARRGMVALSLPVGDLECDEAVAAFDDALASRRRLFDA